MKPGKWARLLFVAAPLVIGFGAGCGDFWQAPITGTTGSFALSNSGSISVSPGATTGNISTITVTPSNSFTGTVALSCAVTTSLSNPTNPATCSLSPTSVSITDTTPQTSTLTATTTSTTTAGAYEMTVSGLSGGVTETTSVCVVVGSSSSSCSSANGNSGVFYVLNQTTNEVAALSLSSGQLNTIGATTLASTPQAIAVAPSGQFLYVSTLDGIYLYEIASDGSLTLGNGGSTLTGVGDAATVMEVDSTNSWLVEAISGTATLYAVNIIPTGSNAGTLATADETKQPFALPASTVTQLAISPGDSSSCGNCYVFVGMGSGGTEAVHFNPGSANPFGTAGTIQLVNSAGGDNAVAVDPTNRLLYVGESDALSATQSGGLRVFTIASGGVTELTSAGSPYSIGGTGPSSILPTADGNYVYVANQSVSGSSTGNIAAFSVTSTALTSIGTVAAGPSGHIGLAEDSTGSYLLAVDFSGNPDLEAYTMSVGALTSVLTTATGTDPVGAVAIAAAP